MKGDDILKQFLSGLGVLSSGYLFLYLMVIGTQHPPIGYALKFVRAFETVAQWLFIIAVVVAVLFSSLAVISHFKNKKHMEHERQKAMRQKEEWQRQKETMDAEEAKLNKIKLEQEKIASEQRQQELNQLRIKKRTT